MVTVICNDSAYGAEYIQFTERPLDLGLSSLALPSFAAMAEVMGSNGLRVSSGAELEDALAEVNSTKGPMLLELVLDPASMPRMHK